MDFAEALHLLRDGRRLARRGWNGTGMWLVLTPGGTIEITAEDAVGHANPELVGQDVDYQSYLLLMTAQGTLVPWLASQTDMLASDWFDLDLDVAMRSATQTLAEDEQAGRPHAWETTKPTDAYGRSEHAGAVARLHALFASYVAGGFTEQQAIELLAATWAAGKRTAAREG